MVPGTTFRFETTKKKTTNLDDNIKNTKIGNLGENDQFKPPSPVTDRNAQQKVSQFVLFTQS